MYFYYIKKREGRPARRYLVKGAYRRALFHNEVDLKANLMHMAYYMRHFFKLPYNDIAKYLQISVSTAYSWVKEIYLIRLGTLPPDDLRERPRYSKSSQFKYLPPKPIRRMWNLYDYIAKTSRYVFNLKGVMDNWYRNIDKPPRPLILVDFGNFVYATPDYSVKAYITMKRKEAIAKQVANLVIKEILEEELNKPNVPEILLRMRRANSWENPAFSRNIVVNKVISEIIKKLN